MEVPRASTNDYSGSPHVHDAEPDSALDVSRGLVRFRERAFLFAFERDGERYLLDPVSGMLFRASESAYLIAKALIRGDSVEPLADRIATAGIDAARTFLRDVSEMERLGLFRRSAMSLEDLHERSVQSYLAHRPRKMMLLVSQTCNLRCIYCHAIDANYEDRGEMMPLETAQQAIRFLAKRSGRRRSLTVTLFGGEPLMNFGMIRALVPWAKRWCRSIGKRIHFTITTNATLLRDEVIDFLAQHQFSISIMISMDGPKAVQDRNRPSASGRGSYDLVTRRLSRLFERHPHPEIIKVRATMTHQHHDVRELGEFFAGLGFTRIGLGANFGYAYERGPYDLTGEDREEVFRQGGELLSEYGLDWERLSRDVGE